MSKLYVLCMNGVLNLGVTHIYTVMADNSTLRIAYRLCQGVDSLAQW